MKIFREMEKELTNLLYFYGIPYRTVQDWEAEKRELPEYVLRLMRYRAEIECLGKKDVVEK